MAQTKNLGIVRVVPKGDWTATTNYEYLNIVRYNGASYIATSASLGIAPDATTGESYWQLISQDVSTAIQEQLNQNTEQIEINTKQISENSTDIALLTTIAEQNSQFYKATTEDAFTTRQTAGGLNLVDPSPATLLSVVGSTVKSKNLLPISTKASQTIDGITFTNNGDGTFTLNGTATAEAIYSVGSIGSKTMPIPAGTYTLSGGISNAIWLQGLVAEAGFESIVWYDYGKGGTYKTTEHHYFRYNILVTSGTVCNNVIVKPMLELGSTATEYVPYFAGLKNASFQGIKSTGKNLFDLTNALNSSKWYYIGGSHFYPLNLMAGKQYTLSGEVVKLLSEYSGIVANSSIDIVRKKDVNSFSFTNIYDIGNAKRAFNFSFEAQGNEYLLIYADGSHPSQTNTLVNAYLNEIIKNLQIEYGSTATAYEPYTENTLELPEAVECGLGTTIDFENKKIVDSGKTIVLTGEEAWAVDKGYTVASGYYSSMYCIGLLTGRENRAYGIATDGYVAHSLDEISDYGNGFWWVGVNTSVLYIIGAEQYFGFTPIADINNPTAEEKANLVAEWKAYLAQRYADGNPVTIRYVSSTSTETPFTSEQSAVGNEYTAHKDGSETVLGNSNQEFGAIPTETNQYYVLGGNPDESQV